MAILFCPKQKGIEIQLCLTRWLRQAGDLRTRKNWLKLCYLLVSFLFWKSTCFSIWQVFSRQSQLSGKLSVDLQRRRVGSPVCDLHHNFERHQEHGKPQIIRQWIATLEDLSLYFVQHFQPYTDFQISHQICITLVIARCIIVTPTREVMPFILKFRRCCEHFETRTICFQCGCDNSFHPPRHFFCALVVVIPERTGRASFGPYFLLIFCSCLHPGFQQIQWVGSGRCCLKCTKIRNACVLWTTPMRTHSQMIAT